MQTARDDDSLNVRATPWSQVFKLLIPSRRLIQMKVAIEWPEEEVRKLQQFAPLDAMRFDNSFRA
jgi:hypothetical protein